MKRAAKTLGFLAWSYSLARVAYWTGIEDAATPAPDERER